MITIEPNSDVTGVPGIPICFEASAIVNIPQEDARCINLASSAAQWTFDSSNCIWTRTSGTNGVGCSVPAQLVNAVYGKQPFYISGWNHTFTTPASPERTYTVFMGVYTPTDFFGWIIYKNCGSLSVGDCDFATQGSHPDRNWKALIVSYGVVVNPIPSGVNGNEQFRVRSDGTYLHWDWFTAFGASAGRWINSVYSIYLPDTDYFTYHVDSLYNNNQLWAITTFKGTYQGSIPMVWSIPLGGTLNGGGNNRCFTGDSNGDYEICVDTEFDDPVCVGITISELTLEPVELECGQCVFVGDIVHFISNGGSGGELTAVNESEDNVGTIIDSLTWQAPGNPTTATITYTLGESEATCIIHVVDRIKVYNVLDNTISGLIPGDKFQILTNYPYPQIVWENIDCPNVISEDGIITIPKRLNDSCFGRLDCYIRGRLVEVAGGFCGNLISGDSQVYIDFRVIVDPVYPTPEFGGPNWVKWKPETPEFKVKVNEFEGGCDETYLKNRVPTYRWTVNYSGLAYDVFNPCAPEPCCDEKLGFIDGYDPQYQVAKRLDDFWNLVYGTAGYFTLFDPRTEKIWRKVRFEGAMERDHINWRRTNSRTFTLIWRPCCDSEPSGGTCSHYTIITDNFAPTIPENFNVTPFSWNRLDVHWDSSYDNVGVKGYQLLIDEVLVDVGGRVGYNHVGLEPTSTHRYRVRSYDFSGNYSQWSDEILGTTNDRDLIPPTIPENLRTTTVNTSSILIEWNDSKDNVEVAGYILLRDGVAVDLGLSTSSIHLHLQGCTKHSYYIKAYDTSGNKSGWSAEVNGFTECGPLFEGTDKLVEGSDTIIE